MNKKIILVHGRAQKPAKEALEAIWHEAIASGLRRDFGESAVQQYADADKEFVYFGDLNNQFLQKPDEDPTSRHASLEELKQYLETDFTKEKYNELHRLGFTQEALADTFSGLLSVFGVAERLIGAVAPDVKHYWNHESYFGSDIRNRLTPVLQKAFDDNKQIMLVGHSLGSIVSYDNLWKFSHYGEYRHDYGKHKKVDLFVTMGSPLGDENVKKNLKGSRSDGFKKYPLNIKRWFNIAAEDDFICHDNRIQNDFEEMSRYAMLAEEIKDFFIYNLTVRNGRSNPHSSVGYLIHPTFSKIVYEWMNT